MENRRATYDLIHLLEVCGIELPTQVEILKILSTEKERKILLDYLMQQPAMLPPKLLIMVAKWAKKQADEMEK